MPGSDSDRVAPVTASARNVPALMYSTDCKIADEIEIESVIERAIDGVGRGHDQEGVTAGHRVRDDRGPDVAGAARAIVHDELLLEPLGECLSDQARDDVGGNSGRVGDDNAHRPRRIIEREGKARQRPGYGRAGGELQKLATVHRASHERVQCASWNKSATLSRGYMNFAPRWSGATSSRRRPWRPHAEHCGARM